MIVKGLKRNPSLSTPPPPPSLFRLDLLFFFNIVASIFAIVAIVLYAIHLGTVNMSWRCHGPDGNYSCYYLATVAQVSVLSQRIFHCVLFPTKSLLNNIKLNLMTSCQVYVKMIWLLKIKRITIIYILAQW